MIRARDLFSYILAVLAFSSTAPLALADTQPPSVQPTNATGVVLVGGWTTNETLRGHVLALRRAGARVGLEVYVPDWRGAATEADLRTSTVQVSSGTVDMAAQKVIDQYPEYTWRSNPATSFVDIYPKSGALSVEEVPPSSITNQSLIGVFTNDPPTLRGLRIDLEEPWPRGRAVNGDLYVTVDFKGGSLMEFFNLLAVSLGPQVSWDLNVGYGHPYVGFFFPNGVVQLQSYQPPDKHPLTPAEELEKTKASLAKATSDSERMRLYNNLGCVYSELGDREAAAKAFDESIRAAPSDEEKCRMREESVQFLHRVNQKAEAEEAIQTYREIIQSCPYEVVRFSAALGLAYILKSYDREAETVAVLKDAATQCPGRIDGIRKIMKDYYPSHLSELPEPAVTSPSAIPPVFYQRLPSTNPPQKEIHFNGP